MYLLYYEFRRERCVSRVAMERNELASSDCLIYLLIVSNSFLTNLCKMGGIKSR